MKVLYRLGLMTAALLLSACGGGSQNTPLLPQRSGAAPSHHAPEKNASGCFTIQDSTGATYTAARLGGGNPVDVEYSSTPCQIGIYINGKNGPNTLNNTKVNGTFSIGIYFDNAGNNAREDHTQICINGSNGTGGCLPGAATSPGTGLYIRNTPNFSADHTSIDSFAAGFATNPCPNNANHMVVDHTVIANATYPWSYEGGTNNFNFLPGHDSPHFGGDSCAGSGVGSGAPSPEFVYVVNSASSNVSAYSIDASSGTLAPVAGSPFLTGADDAVAINPAGTFTYTDSSGQNSVYANAINAATGALSAVPGSPFPTGIGPRAVKVDPTGKFAYVGNAGENTISGYSIDASRGALTPVPGSPFGSDSDYNIAIDATGSFLYVPNWVPGTVSGYTINQSTGALAPISGSPFTGPGHGATAIAVDPSANFLYAGSSYQSVIDWYTIDPATGSLSQVGTFPANYPYTAFAVDPAGKFLYALAGGQGLIDVFAINTSSGALTPVAGSPFAVGSVASTAAVDPTGKYIYVTLFADNTVSGFAINGTTGALTAVPGSPFAVGATPTGIAIAEPGLAPLVRRHHHLRGHRPISVRTDPGTAKLSSN